MLSIRCLNDPIFHIGTVAYSPPGMFASAPEYLPLFWSVAINYLLNVDANSAL
jgi:hypothetical protein